MRMKKRLYSVMNVLCSGVVTALGIVGCKTPQTIVPKYSEKMYGPPPVIIKERVDTIIREEIKTVYGPPVVDDRFREWADVRPDADGVYDVAEVMPQFPGGDQAMVMWICEHLRYPEKAAKEDIHGRVIVSFVVKTDGTLDGVTVRRPLHPQLDAEAIRVVKAMPKWEPGRHRGEVVPVRYFIPIKF